MRHDISSRVIAGRERMGWNRETLAYHSGLSWSAIAQIESGRRTSPRTETLVALAGALGVTVGYLVDEDPKRALLAHRALLYDSDEAFVETIVPFVEEGVERSEPVLLVTSPQRLTLLGDRVRPEGGDVTFADQDEWYRSPLSAVTACRAFAYERMEAGAPWIRFIGDPIWRTGPDADVAGWATYESMFNLLFAPAPLTVLCPYDARISDPDIVEIARQTHPYLAVGAGVERNDEYVDPEEFVLAFQGRMFGGSELA